MGCNQVTIIKTILLYGTGEKHENKQDRHFLGCLSEDLSEEDTWIYDGPTSALSEVNAILFSKQITKNQENIDKIIKNLRQLTTDNSNEDVVINICGHSRGGANALKIANVVAQDDILKNKVKFNIIVNDPVAGPNLKSKDDLMKIPSNVNHYISFIAQNENRRIMRVQDEQRILIEDPKKTSASFLTMPGDHTAVRHAKKDEATTYAPKIFSLYIYKFLHQHGSKFNKQVNNYGKYKQLQKDGSFQSVAFKVDNLNSSIMELYAKSFEQAEKLQKTRSRFKYRFTNNIDYEKQELLSLDNTRKVIDDVQSRLQDSILYICDRYLHNRHYCGVSRAHTNYVNELKNSIHNKDQLNNSEKIIELVKETCKKMHNRGIRSDLKTDLEHLYTHAVIKPESSKHRGIFTKIGQRLFSLSGLSYLSRLFRNKSTDNEYLPKTPFLKQVNEINRKESLSKKTSDLPDNSK